MNDVSYVSHYLDTTQLVRGNKNYSPVSAATDLFSPRSGEGDNKTRWLVFKVKERGKTNLEQVREESIDPRVSNIEKIEYLKESKTSRSSLSISGDLPGNGKSGNTSIQFNWPYDYFSFVELVKLDVKVDSYNFRINPGAS